MINKQYIFLALMVLLCIGLASAANVTTLNSPGNNTVVSGTTVTFNFTIVGDDLTPSCTLYTDDDGTWGARETDSSVANNTATVFNTRTITEAVAQTYNWNVLCGTGDWGTGTDSNTSHANQAFEFGVDATDPSITVDFGTDGIWYTTNTDVRFGVSVEDNNPSQCVFYTTLNTTTNSSEASRFNIETQTFTNNTQFNATKINGTSAWADNGSGQYTWNIICNDTAGNTATLDAQTVLVDTTAPSAFIFNVSGWFTNSLLLIQNATSSTDFTPRISWNRSIDTNFSRYQIIFSLTNYINATFVQKNITSSTTLTTNMSELGSDLVYVINITAYDLAGNSKQMDVINYQYGTDSTGRVLPAGWSIIMNTGNSKNLSSYLTQTTASTSCYFNSSHQFTCHTSGGNNAGTDIPPGEAVFNFLGTTSNYEDAIWNVSAVTQTFNLTNRSATDWNIACNRNSTDTDGKSLGSIDIYTNTNGTRYFNTFNVSRMSYYNWSASSNQYVPYRANWTFNNDTKTEHGTCNWMFLDDSVQTGTLDANNNSYLQLDWSLI